MAENKNAEEFSLDDILNDTYESDEVFSLESILSEYKGSAFIEGEKKTPSHELDDKVREIFEEIYGSEKHPETSTPAQNPAVHAAPAAKKTMEPVQKENAAEKARPVQPEPAAPAPKRDEAPQERDAVHHEPAPRAPAAEPAEAQRPRKTISTPASVSFAAPEREENRKENDPGHTYPIYSEKIDEKYFESKEFAQKVSAELEKQDDWDKSVMSLGYDETPSEEYEEEEEKRPSFFARLFARHDADEEENTAGDPISDEPEEEPLPDIAEEIERFSAPIRLLSLRSICAGVLVVLMVVVTHLYTAGKSIPLGIGFSEPITVGVLMILELLVMMLGLDVLIYGAEDLAAVEPGAESLVLLSCLFTVADGFVMLLSRDFSRGLPFAAVSAASLFFSLRGKLSYHKAIRDSLRMSRASASPFGVVSEEGDDMVVLKKVYGKQDGFYTKLVSRDVGETIYAYAAPILIVLAFLFALIASVGKGRGGDFAHSFAIIMSVAAAFPAAHVFTLPFRYAASSLKQTGGALAGWSGSCDIYDADGALVTDEDVFPVGSVSLSGIKFFEGVNNQKALLYASSVVVQADSGLSRVFAELLRNQGLTPKEVSSFTTYEAGGLGGIVDGERVLVGSGAFMNLMGIRVPEKINVVNTLFAAINDELTAVFTVNYIPANSVSAALRSLLNTKTNIMLAVRDFNVTPNVIEQKFRVSMDGVEYLPLDTSYKLAGESQGSVAAILCREGLLPLADVITKGRLVKLISELNTLISLGGTALGVILMFFLCATESFTSASAENAFIFMMAVEICVFLLSQLVRRRS